MRQGTALRKPSIDCGNDKDRWIVGTWLSNPVSISDTRNLNHTLILYQVLYRHGWVLFTFVGLALFPYHLQELSLDSVIGFTPQFALKFYFYEFPIVVHLFEPFISFFELAWIESRCCKLYFFLIWFVICSNGGHLSRVAAASLPFSLTVATPCLGGTRKSSF